MKITRIDMLFLIWLLPVLVGIFYYGARRRSRILAEFGAPLPPGQEKWTARRRRLRAVLICLSMLCGILALAGPRYGYQWEEISRKGVDLVVALDCSRSMMTDDIHPTRLERAKREIHDLLAMIEGDRIGLVAFAGTAFLQCPLTLDHESFHLFLQALTPDYLPVGGTDLSAAVETAISAFPDDSAADRAVILITDGEHTGKSDPAAAAEKAGDAGIRIFGIGVGSREGMPVPGAEGGLKKDKDGHIVVSRLDEDRLKRISVLTGGSYVRSVSGDMDLDAIYRSHIRELKKTTLTSGKKQIWEDRFQWLLLPGVFFLLLEIFLPRMPKKSGEFTDPLRRTPGGRAVFSFLLILVLAAAPARAAAGLKEAAAAYDAGEYETALKGFIKAQLEDPDNPDIGYNIGNTYYRLGQYTEARRQYESVLGDELRQPPAPSPDPAAPEAAAPEKPGLKPETASGLPAKPDMEQNADPPAATDLEKKALFNLGNTFFRMNRHDDAIARYEQLLSITPDDEQVKKNLEFVRMVKKQTPPSASSDESDSPEKNDDQEKGQHQPSGSREKKDGGKGEPPDKPDKEDQTGSNQPDPGRNGERNPETTGASGEENGSGDDPETASGPGGMPEEPEENDSPGENGPDPLAAAKEEGEGGSEEEESQDREALPPGRVLNRLRDIPGAALVKPELRKKKVEKDW
ncbi:MAG: hypothetical protein CSB33_02815 [Desulfobacterales bacterium]|nr:MAG: hypothetical protein CSB33_02815 [Desulfobacterales bacterium]